MKMRELDACPDGNKSSRMRMEEVDDKSSSRLSSAEARSLMHLWPKTQRLSIPSSARSIGLLLGSLLATWSPIASAFGAFPG